jgi:hypothetical protein
VALGLEILIAAFFVEPFITLQNFAVAGKGEWIFNPFFFFFRGFRQWQLCRKLFALADVRSPRGYSLHSFVRSKTICGIHTNVIVLPSSWTSLPLPGGSRWHSSKYSRTDAKCVYPLWCSSPEFSRMQMDA